MKDEKHKRTGFTTAFVISSSFCHFERSEKSRLSTDNLLRAGKGEEGKAEVRSQQMGNNEEALGFVISSPFSSIVPASEASGRLSWIGPGVGQPCVSALMRVHTQAAPLLHPHTGISTGVGTTRADNTTYERPGSGWPRTCHIASLLVSCMYIFLATQTNPG